MTDSLGGLRVQRDILIHARPETIFAFFTDPVRLVRWKGIDARLDVRPGGAYRLNVTGQNVARGEFVEIVPNRRLVMTWGWEAPPGAPPDAPHPLPPGASRVEIDLTPEGDGTRVRLTHSGLPTAEVLGQQTLGWDHYLARLRTVAEGGQPGPDPWATPG